MAGALHSTASAAPIPGGWRDIPSALDRSFRARSDEEALVGRFHRYSYRGLAEAVRAAASALHALGVRPGDRVAASARNHPDIVIAYFATQLLGGVWLGVNRALAAPEKAFQLQDSGAKVFLADSEARAQVEAHRAALPELVHVVDMEAGASNEWLDRIAAQAGMGPPRPRIDPHAPAGLAYTSGTTGRPKGVVHSQHNMMVVAASFHEGLRGPNWSPTIRRGVTLSLSILNMMMLDALSPIVAGGCCVCIDRSDAEGIARWVEDERVEYFICAPATAYDLLNKPELSAFELSSLKFGWCGGAAVPDELRLGFQDRFAAPLLGGYGLTEMPTNATVLRPDRPFKPGSSGRALASVRVGILDAEGRELPPGELGEICVRAAGSGPWAGVYTPMLGYWNRPEETAEALRGGWLHTGDIGLLDKDGDLFVKDRLKEIIIRGGANIYPAEIERVLMADPRVRAAVVVGRPDPRAGEVPVAFIETDAVASDREALLGDLKRACAEQLARYKLPADWRVLEALPRNEMNKVVRAAVRAMLA